MAAWAIADSISKATMSDKIVARSSELAKNGQGETSCLGGKY
jgi:hypothetical protein